MIDRRRGMSPAATRALIEVAAARTLATLDPSNREKLCRRCATECSTHCVWQRQGRGLRSRCGPRRSRDGLPIRAWSQFATRVCSRGCRWLQSREWFLWCCCRLRAGLQKTAHQKIEKHGQIWSNEYQNRVHCWCRYTRADRHENIG